MTVEASNSRKQSKLYLIIKRLFDIVSSLLLTILVSPVFLVLAIMVKAEDGGNTPIGEFADNYLGKSGTRQVIRSTGSTIGREIGKTIGEAVLGKKGRTIGGNIGSAIGRNLLGTLTSRK